MGADPDFEVTFAFIIFRLKGFPVSDFKHGYEVHQKRLMLYHNNIDIDLNKVMTNHKDTLIKEATQLTQIVNLLDKSPDTDVPIRPPDTDIPTRPLDTDIPNRPINILTNNNPPDPGKHQDRNIPNRPLDIDIPNRLSDSDQ